MHVQKNAILTARFLVNIADVLSGGGEGRANLLEVWRHVQAGNAMLDILYGNEKLRAWGDSQTASGRTVLEEFMVAASVEHLHTGDIYADTEAVLGKIADQMGCGDQVRGWMRDPGYIPESLFYGFVGSPERIQLTAM